METKTMRQLESEMDAYIRALGAELEVELSERRRIQALAQKELITA